MASHHVSQHYFHECLSFVCCVGKEVYDIIVLTDITFFYDLCRIIGGMVEICGSAFATPWVDQRGHMTNKQKMKRKSDPADLKSHSVILRVRGRPHPSRSLHCNYMFSVLCEDLIFQKNNLKHPVSSSKIAKRCSHVDQLMSESRVAEGCRHV